MTIIFRALYDNRKNPYPPKPVFSAKKLGKIQNAPYFYPAIEI